MPPILTSLSKATVDDLGGDEVVITGTGFDPTSAAAVDVLPYAGGAAVPCYSGKSGEAYAPVPRSSTRLAFVAPPLPPGTYDVRVTQDGAVTLEAALEVVPHYFRSYVVHGLRAAIPGRYATGPRSLGEEASQAFEDAPTFAADAAPAGEVGTPYDFTPALTNPTAFRPTFSVATGELPAGLEIDAETGAITGTPTDVEIQAFTVRATTAVHVVEIGLSIDVAAGDGDVIVSTAVTLDDATPAVDGEVVVEGDGAPTLEALATEGEGEEIVEAVESTNVNLGDVVHEATGDHEDAVPIEFVGVGALDAAGVTTTLTPALPAAVQDGDLMLCVVMARNATCGTPVVSGWDLVAQSGGHSFIQLWLFSRIKQAGDIRPDVVGQDTTGTFISQVAAFRNVDPTTPIALVGADTNSTSSTTDIGPITGLTTEENGAVIVVGARANDWTAGGAAVDTLSGDGLTWTEIGEPSTVAGGDGGIAWDFAPTPSATAVSAKTFTFASDGTTAPWTGFMVSLQPAP